MLCNMPISPILFNHLIEAASSFWILSLVIVIGSMLSEDITIMFVGILAASHYFPLLLGIVLLIISIVISDIVAYGIGRMAIHNHIAKRIVEHERIAPLRSLIEKRPRITVFTTRFMPGFRFSLFLACGSLKIDFPTFVFISILSSTTWATILGVSSFFFGTYTLHILGYWRFPILAVSFGILFYIGYRHWKKITEQKKSIL